MPVLLYAFRYKHPRTGKWLKARYRAELHDIQRQYPEHELLGEPEVREPNPGTFNPYRVSGEQ